MMAMEVNFLSTDGNYYDAEVMGIYDDGDSIDITITDPRYTGSVRNLMTTQDRLGQLCECGNRLRNCHPDA